MLTRPAKNTLEAALGGNIPRRFRDFALVLFDGEGAVCVPNDSWLPAAAWAAARPPSGNRLRDRSMLLQRLDVLVTRRGTSIISTTGSHPKLARLRDSMKNENLDLMEWNFPPDEVLDQSLGKAGKPKRPAGDAGQDGGDADTAPPTTGAGETAD